MGISYGEKTINESSIISAFVFREKLSVIRTADGERYIFSKDAAGNFGIERLDDSALKYLAHCESGPIYVVGQDITISDLSRIGQKKDELMWLHLFVPASLDSELSEITRKLMIDSIIKILAKYKNDEETADCLEKVIAAKVPQEADIQGAISYAESLRERGVSVCELFQNILSKQEKGEG